MRKKLSWPFFSTAVFLILLLTTLFARDKNKSLQGVRIVNVGISMPTASFSKQALIEKVNRDPQYAQLPASEKVKVIVQALRKEQAENGEQKKLPQKKDKDINSGSLDSKKY